MSNLSSEVYAMATKKGTRITVDAWGGFAILPAEIKKEKNHEDISNQLVGEEADGGESEQR